MKGRYRLGSRICYPVHSPSQGTTICPLKKARYRSTTRVLQDLVGALTAVQGKQQLVQDVWYWSFVQMFFDTANHTQALLNCKTIKDVPLGGWLQFCCQRLELVQNCNKILTLTIPHVVLSMKVARYISNWLPETSHPGCKISSTGGERLSGPELTVELLSLSLADSWAPRVWKKSPTSKWMLIPSK